MSRKGKPTGDGYRYPHRHARRILRRIGSRGYPQIADRAADVLREMQLKERAEMYNAITGAGYHALWKRVC